MRRLLLPHLSATALMVVGFAAPPASAQTAAPPASLAAAEKPAPAAPEPEPALDPDALYQLGKSLFEEFAPPEVKEQFEFPGPQQWDEFAARFQHALENEDLAALAAYVPEARAALAALRVLPGYEDYADWLAERLDYAEAAQLAALTPSPAPVPPLPTTPPPTIPAKPTPPESRPSVVRVVPIPHYDLWHARIQTRPMPPQANRLLPSVRAAFAAEGVPPDLAWLAEAESTFNPTARSPVGAKGLYQLMPATARELGLSTLLPDERTHPEKSARAAARYLKQLHGRFHDWPLALAAYNAGPGRVRRTLDAKNARTFAEIAPALPAETRMYVPKVLAILAVRAGVAPGDLPPPGR